MSLHLSPQHFNQWLYQVVADIFCRLYLIHPWPCALSSPAVPFLKPELSVNNTAMLASCTTRGGFPQPELTWNHTFQNTSNNRIMKRSEAGNTIRTVEQNGTYLVESAVTVTGSLSVTCRVTNPTSKQIVSNTINFSEWLLITFDTLFIKCYNIIIFLFYTQSNVTCKSFPTAY